MRGYYIGRIGLTELKDKYNLHLPIDKGYEEVNKYIRNELDVPYKMSLVTEHFYADVIQELVFKDYPFLEGNTNPNDIFSMLHPIDFNVNGVDYTVTDYKEPYIDINFITRLDAPDKENDIPYTISKIMLKHLMQRGFLPNSLGLLDGIEDYLVPSAYAVLKDILGLQGIDITEQGEGEKFLSYLHSQLVQGESMLLRNGEVKDMSNCMLYYTHVMAIMYDLLHSGDTTKLDDLVALAIQYSLEGDAEPIFLADYSYMVAKNNVVKDTITQSTILEDIDSSAFIAADIASGGETVIEYCKYVQNKVILRAKESGLLDNDNVEEQSGFGSVESSIFDNTHVNTGIIGDEEPLDYEGVNLEEVLNKPVRGQLDNYYDTSNMTLKEKKALNDKLLKYPSVNIKLNTMTILFGKDIDEVLSFVNRLAHLGVLDLCTDLYLYEGKYVLQLDIDNEECELLRSIETLVDEQAKMGYFTNEVLEEYANKIIEEDALTVLYDMINK